MLFCENYQLCDHKTFGDAFIGANTSEGFSGLIDVLADEERLKRVYVIKGAAGTGKSTLLKNIYAASVNKNINAVRYACSSDPHSLDMVVLNSEVAVLDGTAPHSYDMKYPGAASSIVDLSVFWDVRYLEKHKKEIVELSKIKRSCYKNAYAKLHLMYMLFSDRLKIISSAVDHIKLENYVTKLIGDISVGEKKGALTTEYHRCISTSGRFRLDTLESKAERVVKIKDHYGSAYIMTHSIAEALKENGIRYIRSADPLNRTIISEIYLPESKTLITIEDKEDACKYVNMKRFIRTEELHSIKGEMRLSEKCSEAVDGEVLKYLKLAGEFHRKLEDIYAMAMDFKGLGEYTGSLACEILNNIN